jgi:hypothetical protein
VRVDFADCAAKLRARPVGQPEIDDVGIERPCVHAAYAFECVGCEDELVLAQRVGQAGACYVIFLDA